MANLEHLGILRQGSQVWNEWRREHRDVRPNFNGATFSEADLREADLRLANLFGADLRGADLRGADLSDADLRDAEFRGADLRGASLSMTTLFGTDLSGARLNDTFLYSTTFSSARVVHADFTEALLGKAQFTNMDLSEAIGLESVIHAGPSSIGVDTIVTSKGQIPEIFLRGAGVPDEIISYSLSLRGKPIEFYSCFISYSHKDKAFARRLHDTLQGRGIRCWLDEHQLLPGDDLFQEIDRGIKLWDKVLLCCSEASLTSWWVDNEINTAFAKEQQLMRDTGKKVLALIPLNLDGYLRNWNGGKAEQVRSRLAADFKGWKRYKSSIFESQVERVVKALMTGDAGREAPPPPRLK